MSTIDVFLRAGEHHSYLQQAAAVAAPLASQQQPSQQHHQQLPYRSSSISPVSDLLSFRVSNRTSTTSSHSIMSDFQYTGLLYQISLGVICLCLCLLTITGNLLVLITFRRMRTVGNLFILSLATADLIVGCFVMPIAGIYAIMEKWNMGLVLCQIWLSVDFTASTASIFNLLTLSLDRYWSITSPLQYLGKRTRARALVLIGFAWGLSLLWVIPIFGWHRLVNNGTKYIDSDKCEPEYTHSKVFKVSTAIINFYLPLLVLISLNARIYYEIKRRYKNVLLQRHSTKLTESISHSRLPSIRRHSHIPISVNVCDSDRACCSTTVNLNENDSMIMSTLSPRSAAMHPTNQSTLRINFKERKARPSMPIQVGDGRPSSMKRAYSFIDPNACAHEELSWLTREHSRTSLSPNVNVPLRPARSISHHRLNVDERCFKHTHDDHSCRLFSNDSFDPSPSHHLHESYSYTRRQRTTSICRRCSFTETIRPNPHPTTMNIVSLCHCCTTGASAITINASVEQYHTTHRMSTSSISSCTSRKQATLSSYNIKRCSTTSSILPRSNSYLNHLSSNHKIKQSTVWNQQEKAFRQLFAIVFGFTCCFLPYFILYMVVAFCGSCVSERIVTATIWLGYVNSTINPFLYALSNKHFRRTFNRILKRDQRRQSYYN